MATFSTLPSSFSDVRNYLVTKIGDRYPRLGLLLNASFIQIFVDVVAYAVSLFMNYAENLQDEGKLFSTKTYESARLQAKFFGYVAHRKESASGIIRLGLNSSFNALPTNNVIFNKHDLILINGIQYLIYETKTLSSNPLDSVYQTCPPGQYYIDLAVLQGQWIVVAKTAKGDPDEFFEISDPNIENTEVEVWVNGVQWSSVTSFFKSSPTDLVYMIDNLAFMSGIRVVAGNGFNGKKLVAGDSVEIRYVQTDDLKGQLKSTGLPVTFLVPYTYLDTTPVPLFSESISNMEGASDVEDLESIRYYGQISVSSIDEKAFQDSEVELALRDFGGIVKSKALSEQDVNPNNPSYDFMNTVKILAIPTTGGVLDTTTKSRIRAFLRPKMDFTDFIQFLDPVYIQVLFELNPLTILQNAPSTLAAQIDSYLATNYNVATMSFGQSLDTASIFSNIMTNFGAFIKRFDLYLWVIEELEVLAIPLSGTITRTLAMGGLNAPNPVVRELFVTLRFFRGTGTETIEVWKYDGASQLVFQGVGPGYSLVSSAVDPVTGYVSFTLSPSVTSLNQVQYKLGAYDQDGSAYNVDIQPHQIIRYFNSSINPEAAK